MRILITGGTGFIGRHLTQHLLAHPQHEPILLVREKYGMGSPWPAPLGGMRDRFAAVYADLRNFRLTARAVRDAGRIDAIAHLAAAGPTNPFLNPHTAVRHNLTGTINLIQAAFAAGSAHPGRLLIARTPGEKSKMNPYAASKLAAWHFGQMFARTDGRPIVGGMIFQCYGPGQPPRTLIPAAVRAARAGQDFPMTAGTQKRDWIYIDDVVAGLTAALESTHLQPGETAELGTGRATSAAEVVRLIYDRVGGDGRPQPGVLPTRPGETAVQQADADRTAQQLDGWRAAVPLRRGLQKLLAAGDESGI